MSDAIYAPILGADPFLEVRLVEENAFSNTFSETDIVSGDAYSGTDALTPFLNLVALANAGISLNNDSSVNITPYVDMKSATKSSPDPYEGMYTITPPEGMKHLRLSPETGTLSFTICFHQDFAKLYNKSFLLIVSPKVTTVDSKKGSSTVETIIPYISRPFKVSRHKLVILSCESNAPITWYKDEGGQNKSLEIIVYLKDSKSDFVTTRQFPLKVTLVYEKTREPVPTGLNGQSVLMLMSNSKLYIDSTGHAIVKFRISDVSNRHQGQKFQVLISPDITHSPIAADVAPIYSFPIDVKSKRKKDDKQSRPLSLASLSAQEIMMMDSKNSSKLDMISSVARSLADSSTGSGRETALSHTNSNRAGQDRSVIQQNSDDDNAADSPHVNPNKRPKVEKGVDAGQSSPIVDEALIRTNVNVDSRNKLVLMSAAVSKLGQFLDMVMTDLDTISWKKCHNRSSNDPTPQYLVSNPNNLISRLNMEYDKLNIRESLDLLGNCVQDLVLGSELGIANSSNDVPARSGPNLDRALSFLCTMATSPRNGSFSPPGEIYDDFVESSIIDDVARIDYDRNNNYFSKGAAASGKSASGRKGLASKSAEEYLRPVGVRAPKLGREHSLLGGGIK